MSAWFIAAACVALSQDADRADLAKMQGNWQAYFLVRDDGKPVKNIERLELAIDKEAFTLRLPDQELRGVVRVNAAKTPGTLDLVPTAKEETRLALYEFKGEFLRLALAPAGAERPRSFAAASSNGTLLITLKKK